MVERMNVPRFDKVCHCEQCSEDYADAADDDVRDTEERILASHDSTSRDDNRFGTSILSYREV